MNKGRDDRALAYYYSGFLTEIDYLNNNHRELVTVLYDINKNIFDSTDHSNASWKTISPENSFHLVHAAVYENSKPVAAYEYAPVRSGC